MTSFEIGLLAALIVMIGLLLVLLRNRQPAAVLIWLNYAVSWRRYQANQGHYKILLPIKWRKARGGLARDLNNHCETKMTAPQNR